MTLCIRGGLVCDPESGRTGIMDVLVDGDRVAAIGPGLARDGVEVLDADGMIVGPGFVDLHSHVHSIAGHRLQAMDGVTTALDLEAGLMPIDDAYARAGGEGRPLHYGFSASWAMARAVTLLGARPEPTQAAVLAALGQPAWQRTSSRQELHTWTGMLEAELERGALGIGVLMGYAPQSDPEEFLAVARVAAGAGAPVFTHTREIIEADPGTPIDGSTELVRAAATTGAAMHHCHVNSTSRRHVDRVLAMLDDARTEGIRVTLEAYPYGAGSTAVGAAFLAPELLASRGVSPTGIVMLATGERIADARRLDELRREQPDAVCIVEYLDETDPVDSGFLHRSLEFADTIVASDAMPIAWPDGRTDSRAWPLPAGGLTHPRTAGTFTRALRTMVLERGAWSWVDAFRRCSFLPARVLDAVAPAMRTRGRLSVGATADLVVLDPATLTDRADYAKPCEPSSGVRHLVVAGVPLVRDRRLDAEAYPGRPIRGEPR